LEVLKTHGRSVGVSEISQKLGLAKSTVHRLLVALTNKGMVRQDDDTERYLFGHNILEMAHAASQHWDIIRLAAPYLEELRDRTGESTALALKVGLRFTYITRVDSPHEYRVNPVLGQHYPLHWAATGKAILAHVRERELNECLQLAPQLIATPKTTSDPDTLLAQLEEIRRQDYVVSFGEQSPGWAAIVSPILDRQGCADAAVCLIGPESRIKPQDVHRLGVIVAEIATRIQKACRLVETEG
jgi:DNA-binding IclR family transcriptional regulator